MTKLSPLAREELGQVPSSIAGPLLNEYEEIARRFARGDWGVAELNGGRYAEALIRYLDWKESGAPIPLGNELDRLKILRRVESDDSIPDGIRFHVRRCANLLMDVRNKRDVAHLGPDLEVQAMDARLVMRVADWSLAEIIRVESNRSPSDVQILIDRLSATRLPLVEEIDGELLVLATDRKASVRALIALYHSYPEPMTAEEVRRAIKYKNKSRFRRLLGSQEEKALLHRSERNVYLTRKGVQWVEKNVNFGLAVG